MYCKKYILNSKILSLCYVNEDISACENSYSIRLNSIGTVI